MDSLFVFRDVWGGREDHCREKDSAGHNQGVLRSHNHPWHQLRVRLLPLLPGQAVLVPHLHHWSRLLSLSLA